MKNTKRLLKISPNERPIFDLTTTNRDVKYNPIKYPELNATPFYKIRT